MILKCKRKVLNKVFIKIVKKPYILLLSVLLGIFLLMLIAGNSYQGIYREITDAKLSYSQGKGYEIVAKIDKSSIDKIIKNQSLLWYISEDDIRYRAIIDKIVVSPEGDKKDVRATLIIKPKLEDVDKVFLRYSETQNKIVIVEVMVDKTRLFKFFGGSKGDD